MPKRQKHWTFSYEPEVSTSVFDQCLLRFALHQHQGFKIM
jgi:hypothetical protein